jgi:hypothetical protein
MSLPPPGKLVSARLKVERAREHLGDIYTIMQAVAPGELYEVGIKEDVEARKRIYYAARVEPIPNRILILAVDTIHNLRSALDHLAYDLFMAGPGATVGSPRKIYFPISSDAAKYKSESSHKVRGMSQTAIRQIDANEPFKGGRGHQLWVLHELNNIDKHRLLITLGSVLKNIDWGDDLAMTLERQWAAQVLQGEHPRCIVLASRRTDARHGIYKTNSPPVLKVGDVMLVQSIDSIMNKQLQLGFDIAISEPGAIEGQLLLETLHQLANFVDRLLTEFEPLL